MAKDFNTIQRLLIGRDTNASGRFSDEFIIIMLSETLKPCQSYPKATFSFHLKMDKIMNCTKTVTRQDR